MRYPSRRPGRTEAARPATRGRRSDVTALTFCDSTGVSEMIASLRRSRALGARLVLAGVHGTLERILTITGLRSAFELSPSVEEALQEM
ncbi:hypothetical protein GCM10023075_24750 [Streptosporangium album]|uniref:STAS domain-containing protein n=1 Tax=Streptosporangium album TaxID=47479 RepID=UPI0031E60600